MGSAEEFILGMGTCPVCLKRAELVLASIDPMDHIITRPWLELRCLNRECPYEYVQIASLDVTKEYLLNFMADFKVNTTGFPLRELTRFSGELGLYE
jgi:hypothetical protein